MAVASVPSGRADRVQTVVTMGLTLRSTLRLAQEQRGPELA